MITLYKGHKYIVKMFTRESLEYAIKNKPLDKIFLFPLDVNIEPKEIVFADLESAEIISE